MKTSYATRGTCANRIDLDIENGIVKELSFSNGCEGNLTGISKLVVGMDAREAADRLRGIRCGYKTTSCPDQLSKAIERALEKEGE